MIEKTAIILSGGKNRRMNNFDKAFLKINEEHFIEIILKEMQGFKEVLVVTNHSDRYEHMGVKVIPDIIPDCGPLSGIHAGLSHARYEHSFIIPCDMPFIKRNVIEYISGLANGYDVVVPEVNGKVEPLCGIYSKKCIEPIEECIHQSIYKIIRMYPQVCVRRVEKQEIKPFGNPEELFRNINKPQDYMDYCMAYPDFGC